MSAYDSDFNRGYYQHKRAYSETINSTGAPLPADLLEGEIAINIPLKKLYTKKQDFTTINQFGNKPARVRFFSPNGAQHFTSIRISSAHVGQKVGVRYAQDASFLGSPPAELVSDPAYNSEGFIRYTIVDSDVEPTVFISNFLQLVNTKSAASFKSVSGSDVKEGDDDSFLVFDRDIASQEKDLVFKLDSDFVRYVDHGITKLAVMTVDSDIVLFGNDNLTIGRTNRIKTVDDFSAVTKVTSTGIPVDYRAQNDSEGEERYLIFVRNFNGSVTTIDSDGLLTNPPTLTAGDRIRLLKDANTSSIVDLTPGNTFEKSDQAPNKEDGNSSLAFDDGDFWIENPDTEYNANSAALHWLDRTVISNSTAQAKARAYSDSEREEKGIVWVDSDSTGSLYAEWRKVRSSTDLVADNATPINESITYSEDSVLNIKGNLNIDSEVVINSTITNLTVDNLTLDGRTFVRTQRFEIRDSNDNIKLGFWGLDTDYDSDN